MHTSCECEANLMWIWCHNSLVFAAMFAHFNCCELLVANLWSNISSWFAFAGSMNWALVASYAWTLPYSHRLVGLLNILFPHYSKFQNFNGRCLSVTCNTILLLFCEIPSDIWVNLNSPNTSKAIAHLVLFFPQFSWHQTVFFLRNQYFIQYCVF